MSADKFDLKKATLNDLRTQVEVTKEKLLYKDKEVLQLKQELDTARAELDQQRDELRRSAEELNKLRIDLEVAKEKLRHKNSDTNKKKSNAQLQAILASLLFLFASILSGFGINLITSSSFNVMGTILIALAFIPYIFAAIMTVYVIGGSNQ